LLCQRDCLGSLVLNSLCTLFDPNIYGIPPEATGINLGVPVTAEDETIRSVFRRLSRRYHPDAGQGSSSWKFREITEAYETLMDPAEHLSQLGRTCPV
jgi:preprotein translocase subunit Sec63